MAAACADTLRHRSSVIAWVASRLSSSDNEQGQALVLTVLAMTVLLIMCAASIDLSTWYQKHHQAQVSADAAALAAASCLAHSNTGQTNPTAVNCTSTTDTTDAKSVADSISGTNLPNVNDQVTIDTTKGTVTVVANAQPSVDFAGIVSLHPTVSARSVASYTGQGANFSIFVGNELCTNSKGNTGLQIGSDGGGNAAVTGLYSDGLLDNNDNSNSASYKGGISDGLLTGGYNTGQTPNCGSSGDGKTDAPGPGNTDGAGTGTGNGTGNSWNPTSANTSLQSDMALPYPTQYTQPQVVPGVTITSAEPTTPPTITPGQCTFASTYFSTDGTGIHQISYPGIYCVIDASGNIATSYSGSCTGGPGNSSGSPTDDSTGSIYIDSTLEGSGGFEFVGPCVVGQKNLSGSAPVINSATPLIYGTAGDTSTCLNPDGMVNPTQVVNSYDNVYLYNNNLTLNGTIYAPCGTVELSKNNDFAAFIEAANVTLDQNNFTSFVGTGPPSSPALDGLSG